MVVANNIRIRIYFRGLPSTPSAWTGIGMDEIEIFSASTLAIMNGCIYLVAGFLSLAIGTVVVTGKVATVGSVIVVGFEPTGHLGVSVVSISSSVSVAVAVAVACCFGRNQNIW